MPTNPQGQGAAPRHRKAGPARVGGADSTGKRARDIDDSQDDGGDGPPRARPAARVRQLGTGPFPS